jgi:hypothetical protein
MASQFPPVKGAAFTLDFTLYKNDGTVVVDPGAITKQIIIDNGATNAIAANVTEEDTTYGCLSIVLSTAEMNGDVIWIYITDNTAGTVPFTCTIYTSGQLLDTIDATADLCEDILRNKLTVDNSTGAGTLYADNSTAALLTNSITDNSTLTVRTRLA